MSVAVDIGGPFPHMDTHNKRSEDSIIGDRSSPINLTRSRSPTPPPSCDSLSNLHRVTDMLKDKLNGPSQDHMTSRDAEPANRRSPYSGHVTSSGSGKPINGCGPNMENYAQHHMSVLLNNEVYNNESSNVLRGILQGKDRMMDSESQIRSHRYNNLYGDNKNGSVKDDSDAESFRSVSPGNLSLDDSDPDRRVNGVSDMDEIMDESKDARESFIDNENSNDSERELGEVKMNTFSGDKGSEDPVTPERRPKRKQYIPQQHGTLGEPSTKLRRIEREILQKQLKHMQQQLTVMHQRYCALFDQGEEISGLSDLSGPVLPEGAKMSASKSRSDEKPGIPLDFDPSHFIKQASKLVQEQEFVSKNPCQTSPLSGQTPLDIHNLANQLKDEITHGVGALVDTVVAKFVEDKVKHTSTTVHSPPPVEKPKKERVATPPPPPVEPEVRRKSPLPSNIHNNNNIMKDSSPHFHHKFPFKFPVSSHSFHPLQHLSDSMCAPRPPRTKVTDKIAQPFFDFHPAKPFAELARAHPALFPPPPYFPTQIPPIQPLYAKEPEQTEPMSLVLGSASQKKKRTKVTDTRLSPRAARALLQEGTHHSNPFDLPKHHPGDFGHPAPPLIPISLPTSVAIPNPSLQQSDILSMYSHEIAQFEQRERERVRHSPSASPSMSQLHDMHHSMKDLDFDQMESNYSYDGQHMTSTLTPMHLRKAKLMFFYTRYPSSSILKIYFPDVKFNKNNTAQLVKWFSNFREFFYIQMEKYARQALAEGVKNADDLIVTLDSELYRILNLHYNRNNQIEVPDAFRGVVQATLREFFKSIQAGKDSEQSWKKAIYKIIARLDDGVPEYFKSPNWMEQLNDG